MKLLYWFLLMSILLSCRKNDIASNIIYDIDGNEYPSIHIGGQIWMGKNLEVSRLNDGTPISDLSANFATWKSIESPAYGIYKYYKPPFPPGKLYNWYTVNTCKICPTGWHIPSDEEWSILENYLISNKYNFDGTFDNDNDRYTNNKIAKSLSNHSYWIKSTVDGAIGDHQYSIKNNLTRFSALPEGYITKWSNSDNYGFVSLTANTYWWASNEDSDSTAFARQLWYNSEKMYRVSVLKKYGFSIRCLRD